jgi:hypothetical protein
MAHPNSHVDDSDEQELCQLFAELPLGPITIYPTKAREREFKYFSKLPAELQVMIWKHAAAFTSNLVHIFDHPALFAGGLLPPLKLPIHNFCDFYAWPWHCIALTNKAAYRALAPFSVAHRLRLQCQESFPETIRLRSLNSSSGRFCPDIAYLGSWNAMRYIIREADRPFLDSVEILAINNVLYRATEDWFVPALALRFVNLKELVLVLGDDDPSDDSSELPESPQERKNRRWPWELLRVPVSKGYSYNVQEDCAPETRKEIDKVGRLCCYDLGKEMRKYRYYWVDSDEDGRLHENWHKFLDLEPLPTPHENGECRKEWKAPKMTYMKFKYHDQSGRKKLAREL